MCPAGDGVFATSQNGEIALVDLKSNKTTTLVKMDDVKDVRLREEESVWC